MGIPFSWIEVVLEKSFHDFHVLKRVSVDSFIANLDRNLLFKAVTLRDVFFGKDLSDF